MSMTNPSSSTQPVRITTRRPLRRTPRLCIVALACLLNAAAGQLPKPQSPETLITEGEAAIIAGNAKVAMSRFQAALPLAEQTGDERLIGRSVAGLGWAQWAAGQYDHALATRRRALEIFTRLEDVPRVTASFKALGETLYSMGRFDDALAQYELGLESNRKSPEPVQEGLILSNMGSTYRSLGRLNDASDVLERALSVLRSAGHRGAIGQVLTFLGIVSRALGQYDRALLYYQEALAAHRESGDRRAEAQVLGNTANVHLDLGDLEQSVALNQRSLAIAEEVGYAVQVGFAHQNLGAALSRIPRPQEALKHYQLGLQTYRKIGRQAQIPWALVSIGTLQAFLLDDPEAGRATLNEGLKISEAAANREAIGHFRYELGSLDMKEDRLEAGLQHLDAALQIARDLQMPDLEYQVLANRGLLLSRLGRSEAAIANLRASAAIVNDLRANVSSDLAKIAYVDTRQSVFHDLALVLAASGRPEEALEAAEAGRARALADLLSQRQVVGRPAERQALQDVRAALAAATSKAPAGGIRGGKDAVATAIQKLESQDQELVSLLTVASPAAAEIKATAARLSATVIEYLVTERALLIWVVAPDGHIRFVRRDVPAGDIARRVERIRRALDEPTLEDLRAPRRLDPDLRALHQILVAPISRWLPASSPAEPVIVIPHGPTALVPFAALQAPDGSSLVDRHVLAVAPAISTFRYTAAKRRPGTWRSVSALVVADPVPPDGSGLERLPGTLDEGRKVASRLGSGARLLTGSAATEASVKKEMAGRRVLHLATHGLISPVRPIASSVLLAEGGGEDGYLRLDEVFGLELSADLVVLSGCSTGLGRLSGDGIFGLTRGFIYAGTPSVVVSMWDVSDRATAFLMDRFYAALAQGHGKAAALAAAQRAARKQYPHPSLWAAFVLVGEPR
jgi:CHAT domain-containing protein